MLELYHWEPIGNSAEPIILLKEKGLAFESRYLDLLRFEQHAPAFLKINPQGQVPTLVHDGRTVTETTLLLQYIEAAFPEGSLLPDTPHGRYQMQVWSKYADEYLAPAIAMLGWHKIMFKKLEGKLEAGRSGLSRLPPERQAVWRLALGDSYTDEQLANARSRLEVRVRRLEQTLASSRFLAGAKYSLADIMVYPLARALPVVVPELVNERAAPHTTEWLAKIGARPAVRQTLAMAKTDRPEEMFAPGPEVPRWG